MGTDGPEAIAADHESPAREVEVAPFAIDAVAVSNARFAAFVRATGHRTDAELFGCSSVFAGHLPARLAASPAPAATPWWREVAGASWRQPEGPGSSIGARMNHPVVHVSWRDAQAFCGWAGLRLPREEEWEFAARGGLEGRRYPWGDELRPDGAHRCNIWQGEFPWRDTAEDGFAGTAPVRSFPPNGYGLYQAVGNTWEWCADSVLREAVLMGLARDDGPKEARALRGGSFLCHESYCFRYRVSARFATTPETSTSHIGFRVASDIA